MTYVKEGFVKLKEESHTMCFGINKNESSAKHIGTWKGRQYKVNKEDRCMDVGMQVTLQNTLYIPNLMVNLFSLTKVISEGGEVMTTKEGWMGVRMGDKEMIFLQRFSNICATESLLLYCGLYMHISVR